MAGNAKHTPGPWYAGQEGDDWKVAGGYDARARVLSIRTGVIPSVEDARLIAAAPDLLAAHEAIIARVDGDYDNPYLVAFGPLSSSVANDVAAISRAAIAKAQGRS